VISLPEATKIIREAGTYGKTFTDSALAAYAGHQTANSGAWMAKRAALKDWGLITGSATDSFVLTERALRIALPTSPPDAQAAQLEAFQSVDLFMNMVRDLAIGVELAMPTIGNRAVTSFGVAIASKDRFVRSFVESAVAVGLAEQVAADKVKLLAASIASASDDAHGDLLVEEYTPLSNPKPIRQTVPVVNQTWAFNGGAISFQISTDRPLSAEAFGAIGPVVNAISGLVGYLDTPPGADSASGDVSQ